MIYFFKLRPERKMIEKIFNSKYGAYLFIALLVASLTIVETFIP